MIETTEAETPILRRRGETWYRHHPQRSVGFFDRATRTLALDTLRLSLTLESDVASDLLAFVASLSAAERPRVVYITGGDEAATTPAPEWFTEPVLAGWNLRRWHNDTDRRTGVYDAGDLSSGVTIDLRMAAPWFGAATDASVCLAAWRLLGRQLRGAFGDHLSLLTTPAMTGTQLLEASLPASLSIPTLPDALRTQITAFSTQGRRELFTPPAHNARLPELVELDCRFAYAAACHHLPVGPVVEDGKRELAPYVPGFYLVEAVVPRDWAHIGLLPDLASIEDATERVSYPRRPRHKFWSWATGAEVELARAWGWRVTIYQRILWPETHRRPDVAKLWIERLVALRRLLRQRETPDAQLAANAVRHLVIDAIGSFYRRERPEHGILPLARIDELPAGAIPHVEGDQVLWQRLAPIAPDLLRYAHPEWAATVWGRTRVRLAKQALRMPFDSLVALRTDGIWTCANAYDLAVAEFNDTSEKPGTWRVKSSLSGSSPAGLAWPENEAALIALMRRARADEEE